MEELRIAVGLLATICLSVAAIRLVISLRDRERIQVEERAFLIEVGLLRHEVTRLERRISALEQLLPGEGGE